MANTNQPARKREGLGAYLRGVRKELSKVIWPTKKELAALTGVVIVFCAVFALGFWLVDMGVLTFLQHVLGI